MPLPADQSEINQQHGMKWGDAGGNGVDATYFDNGYLVVNTLNGLMSTKGVIDGGAQVYNVKSISFGAKGDGISDDTAAINAASSAANTAGGGRVYFPRGTYLYSSALNLYSNVTFEGTGTGSILRRTANANIAGTGLTGVRIINLRIDGNSRSFDQIQLINCTQSVIQNCTIQNADSNSAGVTLQDGSNANVIRDCYFSGNGCGVNLLGQSTAVTNNEVVNNTFSANGTATLPQIWLRGTLGASNNLVQGNVVVGNAAGYGIAVAGSTPSNYNRIVNNVCSNNGISGILCNADRNIVQGNHCNANSTDGIDAGNSSFCLIESNYCFGNGGNGIELNAFSSPSNRNVVVGNTCQQNSKGGSAIYDGIVIQANSANLCQNHIIIGNTCFDDAGTPLQNYGINEKNGGVARTDQNLIAFNNCRTNLTGGVTTTGPNTIVRGNLPVAAETGPLTLLTSGSAASLTIQDTGANGANLKLQGQGGVTPTKTMRVSSGTLQFLNDAYNTAIASLTDAGAFSAAGSVAGALANPVYGASVAINAAAGDVHRITANNTTAFTVANPTNPTNGQRITITIRNTSGGALGAVTWDTLYRLAAWTSPATGNSRSIDFEYDATNWVEKSRTPADVPN